jgi:hypothetical protein
LLNGLFESLHDARYPLKAAGSKGQNDTTRAADAGASGSHRLVPPI